MFGLRLERALFGIHGFFFVCTNPSIKSIQSDFSQGYQSNTLGSGILSPGECRFRKSIGCFRCTNSIIIHPQSVSESESHDC
jgi:hypothetical protein